MYVSFSKAHAHQTDPSPPRAFSLSPSIIRSFRGLGLSFSVSETINFLENSEGFHEEDLVCFSVVSTLQFGVMIFSI